MAREGTHVRHQDRAASDGRGATNALPHRDTYACWLALERPQHEFRPARQVEPRPVQLGPGVIDCRCSIREIGRWIGLAREQSLNFPGKVSVCRDLAATC